MSHRFHKISARPGANVNAKDKVGHSVLLYAAVHGCTETAQAQLNNDAGVDAISEDGRAALRETEYMGHTDTV